MLNNIYYFTAHFISNILHIFISLDPNKRPTATQLLNHEYFTEDHFNKLFMSSLHHKMKKIQKSPLIIESGSKNDTDSYNYLSIPRTISNIPKIVNRMENL